MTIDDLNDPVDRALLPILRHAVYAFTCPERCAWRSAYMIAAERWGEPRGLALAHATIDLVSAVLSKDITLEIQDPLDVQQRSEVTEQEHQILLMVRFMRQQDKANARNVMMQLCDGHIYAAVVRAALALASRLDHTGPNHTGPNYTGPDQIRSVRNANAPRLSAVS
ncbi:hypothetical protein ACG74X_17730 [Marivita sp. S0852]|uniref:hypothetical protein n=1 Tax=Marivita sp. S0852 TaxID=3373893 RepID=UPI0039824E44